MKTPQALTSGIPLIIQETVGILRENLPVRTGIPCPRGLFYPGATFFLQASEALPRETCIASPVEGGPRQVKESDTPPDTSAADGFLKPAAHGLEHRADASHPRPTQTRATALWPDGSIKWLLTDFCVSIAAGETQTLYLFPHPETERGPLPLHAVNITETREAFVVDTGAGIFKVSRDTLDPFISVETGDRAVLTHNASRCLLTLPDGSRAGDVIDRSRLEERGPLRATLVKEGRFVGPKNQPCCNFALYQTFFAGSTVCLLDCILHNPRAARHPGGVWDLGDPGSFFFKELALSLGCERPFHSLEWQEEPSAALKVSQEQPFILYQDSSGLENWDSVNHIDRESRSTVSFKGYKVKAGRESATCLHEGDQATPLLKVCGQSGWVAATVADFWQNFPKSLEAIENTLIIGLFPRHCSRIHELQGGERKRHSVLLDFGLPGQPSLIPQTQAPLNVFPDPQWTERTQAVPWFTARQDDPAYSEYVSHILTGPRSFLEKRNIIDEYGWRNFGDIYADHEAVHHRGPGAFIAHYNNQYDFVWGGIVHFLRTGDPGWFELARDLARHVADIDIYHTDEDKAAFNHGQFWHTDHYNQAHTCTHRSFTRFNRKGGAPYGGGPSNENNYTTGLLHYHHLTGDPLAREAVLELASWVLDMDDGSKTLFAVFDDGPTGLASQTAGTGYHKPGRGAGNSINALLDAFQLTQATHYLHKAEELIERCIHPKDDINALRLDEPEHRWSYLVFLQVLGKYLDLKVEHGALDAMYHYARESLLHYAAWMLENEKPYSELLHKVELPTETWPAQDVRKSHVFYLAAKHAPPEVGASFKEKAEFYFHRCLKDLLEFETAYLTRPMVLLAVYGPVHAFFQQESEETLPHTRHALDFGSPRGFVPQKTRFRQTLTRNLRQSLKGAWQLAQARRP